MGAARSAGSLPLPAPAPGSPASPSPAPGPGRPDPAHVDADFIDGVKQPRKPISRARIEVVVSRSVAVAGVVFSLQALPAMLIQVGLPWPPMALATPVALAVSIGFFLIASIAKVGVRVAAGAVAVIYLAALIAWPLLMSDPNATLDGKPWLWYLNTVATACAAVSFRLVWAASYTVLAPVAYGIIRSLPSGGGADALLSSLDAVYATLLGQVILIMIFMLRQTAAAVDEAQTNALEKYATAVRQHATEVERVQVDSIVHDSVLATFLASAAAGSPKAAQLASAMATDALTRLNDAAITPAADDTRAPFGVLAERIRGASQRLVWPFTIVEGELESLSLPVHVSEALFAASVQAMVNSVQHAGSGDSPPDRTLTMSANVQGGCTITIADTGAGFDPAKVPSERLGLRISIQDRVAAAGGSVSVRSSVGHGTTIVLEWPPGGREVAA